MQRSDSLEKFIILQKMERKKKEDDQKQDGWWNLVATTMGAWLEDLELGGGQIILQVGDKSSIG